ncbi:hypothetical protein MPL3356_70007 [Mesorhizobium plurifarium]|uniref:Uncharacterized protein n=1 Tax=Mesorhizobium plurifarium TaxID=69974 RepID=A0A090EBL0_MESPL|nr:hypothetical protein MPL3356_70007 [Mesorhizobium plurifarium]CDX60040.1 hypothetical protein MPL3365_310005 [Mesorhizobium plurifarium]
MNNGRIGAGRFDRDPKMDYAATAVDCAGDARGLIGVGFIQTYAPSYATSANRLAYANMI